jgi:hypothetical protein
MAWGNKKQREDEYLRTGQAAALRPGDLGAKDIYDDGDDDDAGFMMGWETDPDPEG